MDHFGGLDVSVKETSICIVDDTGRIAKEVKVASEAAAPLKVLRGGTRMLCRCLALTRKECALEPRMRV